ILVSLLFRGLVRLGPGDTIVADLAQRWEVDESGAAWTFHLRPRAVWQDGTPITADDVAFTISVLGNPAYTGAASSSWRGVQATATDSTTIRIELASPIGGFLQAATQPIAPSHILGAVPPESLADDPFGQTPVGSGPFRLVSLEATEAVLEAWAADPAEPSPSGDGPATVGGLPGSVVGGQPRPYLPGIELRFFGDLSTLITAWNAATLDAVSGLTPEQLAELDRASPDARIAAYPGSTLLTIIPNLRVSHTALRDAAVRRALLGAVNREAIIADVLAGYAARADTPIPNHSWAFDAASSPPVPFDTEAAMAALTAAGWTRSSTGWTPTGATTPLVVQMIGPDEDVNPTAYAVARSVARAWREIGLAVDHVGLDATTLSERLRSGDFDVAVIAINVGLDPDLFPLLASSQTTGARTNVLGLQDPALDALLSAARAPGTLEARTAAYTALQVRLAATTYLLPLAFRDEVALVRDTVTGATIRAVGDVGGRFWDVLTWRLADDR
ncbi:MAG: ABC transporter substrate-binding protein, partial [Chloroflexi bacterium]|nr:ABC transporter substrate-binding protein [Chloroflexota bacterium]